MPESKIIDTLTDLLVSGTSIQIHTYYNADELPNTLKASIGEEDSFQDGTPYTFGDGIIKMKNHPDQIDYDVDDNGELILLNMTGDEDKYSINDNGELIYTF